MAEPMIGVLLTDEGGAHALSKPFATLVRHSEFGHYFTACPLK